MTVSHETIYKHIWEDKRNGGLLYKHLDTLNFNLRVALRT